MPAVRFADAARRLGAAARACGLLVPAFRSPPRVRAARRTLRRYPGGAVVSVQLRGRGYPDVVDDMIEGVLTANRVDGDARTRLRGAFRRALGEPEVDLIAEERRDQRADPPSVTDGARVAERQTQAA